MTAYNPGFLGTFRQYAGKLKTMRDEVRTRRFLDSLPARHPQGHRLAGPLSAHRPAVRLTPVRLPCRSALPQPVGKAAILTGS